MNDNNTEKKQSVYSYFFQKNKLNFLMSIFTQLLGAGLYIMIAILLMRVIETMELKDSSGIGDTLILAIAFALAYLIFGIFKKIFVNRFLKQGLANFKNYIFSQLLNKSISDFSNKSTSKVLSAFTNDLSSIEQNYLNGFIQIIYQGCLFLGTVLVMLMINWKMMIGVFVGCLIPMIFVAIYGQRLIVREQKTSTENESFVEQVKDLVNGFIEIKSFKAEKEVLKIFYKQNILLEEVKSERRETNDTMNLSGELSSVCVVIIICGFGFFLTMNGSMSIGEMIAYIQLSNYIIEPLKRVFPLYTNIKASAKLIKKIEMIVTNNSEVIEGKEMNGFNHMIAMKEVSFSYGEKKVLREVNLEFEKGKNYAIVGPSGSGKSTLLQIILGHHMDYIGSVTYDDKELREICLDSLYKEVSVMQQNVFLFNSSIIDNITMFKSYSKEQIEKTIELAGLSELIDEKGLDYLCGCGGINLSGGERQRVSIARSLLRSTPILVMDEATSALDNAIATNILENVLNIKDTTKIIITHKIEKEQMKKYDEIIVMKNGRIFEKGKFDELMDKKGLFYALLNVTGSADNIVN